MPEAQMSGDRISRHQQVRLIFNAPNRVGGGCYVSMFAVQHRRGVPDVRMAHHEYFEGLPDLTLEELALVAFDAFLRRTMLL